MNPLLLLEVQPILTACRSSPGEIAQDCSLAVRSPWTPPPPETGDDQGILHTDELCNPSRFWSPSVAAALGFTLAHGILHPGKCRETLASANLSQNREKHQVIGVN
jgi:hypothetical protein